MTGPAASEWDRRRFLSIAGRTGILASAAGLLQLPLSSCTSLLPGGPPAPRLLPSKRPLPAPFQVLSRAGGLRPTDHGWKDSIHLSPAQPVTIATRFNPYHGRYLAHCHNLEHEDMAMMAVVQFLP